MIVAVSAVRDNLGLNASNSKYPDTLIGSNIRAAQSFLERRTGRIFEKTTATKLFTTEGKPLISIPGLKTATAVTLNGSALTADSTYWLLPDAQQTGVSTAIQFRPFDYSPAAGGNWYLSIPDWWDRGLDMPGGPVSGPGSRGSLPNDLSIAGDWGYDPDDLPEEAIKAVVVLAGWMTKRADAILSGAVVTPEGNTFVMTDFPVEVSNFIAAWRLDGASAEGVG
jgi:hypothetical protein